MKRLMMILVGLGIALPIYGYREWRLSQVAHTEPQKLTVEQLTTQGYGDNAHVVLADFLCPGAYVYQEEKRSSDYDQVWIATVPLYGPYHQRLIDAQEQEQAGAEAVAIAPPEHIALVITSKQRADDDAVSALMDADTLQGMITNEMDSLDRETKDLLNNQFENIDVDSVLIFEEGRRPATLVKVVALVGSGLGLLVGVAVLFLWRRRSHAEVPEAQGDPAGQAVHA